MTKTDETRPPFDLSGGHPALDFVNSLDKRFGEGGPLELLASYADLLRFMEQTKLLDAPQTRRLAKSTDAAAGARALRSARELREALAVVFYGTLNGRTPPPEETRILGRHFRAAAQHRELHWQQAANAHLEPRMGWEWGRFEGAAELPVWILSQTAADLMTSDAMGQVRACGADTCRWLFLDTSKNHTRRWCNMKVCGNRMKARRFHARHA